MQKYSMYGYINKENKKITPYKNLICNAGYSNKILYFAEGIPGYEKINEFGIQFDDSTNPFLKISSCNDGDCCFLCIDPNLVLPDYSISISPEDKLFLNIIDSFKILLPLVKTAENINIKTNRPILINTDNFMAKILSKSSYPVVLTEYKKMSLL